MTLLIFILTVNPNVELQTLNIIETFHRLTNVNNVIEDHLHRRTNIEIKTNEFFSTSIFTFK